MPEHIGAQECARCQSYNSTNKKSTLYVFTRSNNIISVEKKFFYLYTVRPRFAREEIKCANSGNLWKY